jgi:DNA-binding MarR family transcriptional regulator
VGMAASVSDEDYHHLLRFRTGMRRFERWSEQQSQSVGLTGAQHQLLLAVRGHPDRRGPTVAEVSEYLLLRHHSVVELVDRAESAGLLRRASDPEDRRLARLRLTSRGSALLGRLSRTHLDELARLDGPVRELWRGLEPTTHLPPDKR